jgi:uncharacterized membrane protein HdeD (DUF308 family)
MSNLRSSAVCEALGLSEQWWAFAVRGAFAIVFALAVWAAPHTTAGLAYLFGVYAFVDGVFGGIAALRRTDRTQRRWGMLAVQGAAGIAFGLFAIFQPRMGPFALLFLVAGWAIMTGIAQIGTAIRLRQESHGEWILSLCGALSVAFGFALFFFPGHGVLARALWIGAYALVLGGLSIVIAVRLRADHGSTVVV